MSAASYLFAPPENGPLLTALAVCLALLFISGLAAWVIARRSEYASIRRRARDYRSIAFWTAIPGGFYLQARYHHLDFLQLRIWLFLILAVGLGRALVWALALRRLGHDKVEERQARRKQSYFRPSSRKPAKRRRK